MNINNDTDQIILERFTPLHLVTNTPKGRAIIAAHAIPSGTTIDISPVLVLSPTENKTHIEHTSLYHYTYNWPSTSSSGQPITTQAIVLGLGSLFNHSKRGQNVGWTRDVARGLIVYHALRDVAEGEELCISYGDRLTFVDVDAEVNGDEVGGDGEAVEDGEEVLGRIEVDGL